LITLASDSVALRLDPGHGAEVLDLIDLRTGRQLLGRPPFASDEPVAGELDEVTWTRSYRGGWQLLTPNAGNACVVDGEPHGFHGRCCTEPWSVVERSPAVAELHWRGHGLTVGRRFSLVDESVIVASTVEADRSAWLVWVEHVALGIELLDPTVEIELPDGRAYEVDERTGPTEPPETAGRWPEVRRLDGTLERADRAELRTPRSRMMVVSELPEGRVVIRNPDRHQGIELRWDMDWLPHLWIWHEVRTSGGPWRQLAEVLVVEPASVPHTLGLETARARGQAHRLEPGQRVSTELVLTPLHD
jgi:hypothetical protein